MLRSPLELRFESCWFRLGSRRVRGGITAGGGDAKLFGHMSRRAPALLLVCIALAGALLACGGGGEEAAVTTTTEAPTTTTTEPSTTTTQSEEERAIEALEGMTSAEEAQFRLFSNPPEIPGPLAPLNAVAEPIGEPVPILRAGPDGLPVLDEAGNDIIVGVRFDALGRPVAADDGRLLDDQGVEIPRDAQGPILLFVQLDEAGQPRRQPLPPPPPTTPPPPDAPPTPAPPPTQPPLGRVIYERRPVAPANRVVAVGDSVLLGVQGNLPGSVLGWAPVLDAQESRLPGVGDDVIFGRPDLGRVLVVMLGHNVGPGEDYRVYLNSIQQAIDQRPVIDRVIWVTAAEIGQAQLAWSETLRAYVEERRAAGDTETHLLDWALYNAANPGYSDDGLHLTLDGRAALAGLIGQFVGPSPGDCDIVIGAGPQAGSCA